MTPAVDAPGPLRAAARPVTPPFTGEGEIAAAPVAPGPGPLQALKERMEGLFNSNGHAPDEDARDHVEATGAPLPRRSAAAARARAGATVAARRSPVEVWALRIFAAVFVAVLLTAFLLFVIHVA